MCALVLWIWVRKMLWMILLVCDFNCGVIPTHYKYICGLALNSLQMAK